MCHGIPNKRPFQDGDYVNYDVTIFKNGVHGDNSLMVELGDVDPDVQKLVPSIHNDRFLLHRKLFMKALKFVRLEFPIRL